jgi:TetR/AcrR family transcriptional regulator
MGLKERRAREKQERKKQILDAARTLLFEKGLHATSINQIAKTAELGVGTIYFYYQSKEEIFSSLQEEGLELLYDRIAAIAGSDIAPEEKLRGTARAYLGFSREHKNYFDIINYFLSSPQMIFKPDVKTKVDMKGRRILSLIVTCIEEGRSRGDFRSVDPGKYATMFWAALYGLIQFKKLEQTVLEGHDHRSIFDYTVDQLIDGLKNTKGVNHGEAENDPQ